jgi:hypothetical protein
MEMHCYEYNWIYSFALPAIDVEVLAGKVWGILYMLARFAKFGTFAEPLKVIKYSDKAEEV